MPQAVVLPDELFARARAVKLDGDNLVGAIAELVERREAERQEAKTEADAYYFSLSEDERLVEIAAVREAITETAAGRVRSPEQIQQGIEALKQAARRSK